MLRESCALYGELVKCKQLYWLLIMLSLQGMDNLRILRIDRPMSSDFFRGWLQVVLTFAAVFKVVSPVLFFVIVHYS